MKQNGLTVGIPHGIIGEGQEIRYRGTDQSYLEWHSPDGHKRVEIFDTEKGWFTDAYIADSMIPEIKAGKLVLFDQHLETDSGGSQFRRDVRGYADESLFADEDNAYIAETRVAMRKRVEFFPQVKPKYDVSAPRYAFSVAANAAFGLLINALGLVTLAASKIRGEPEQIKLRPDKREP